MNPLALLSSDSRRELLELVKKRGDVSIDEAVVATKLSRTTVREHFLQLEGEQLVQRFTEKQEGRGRPPLRYRIAPAGEQLFPERDGALLHGLIGFLQEQGREDLIQAFFEEYWETRVQAVEKRLRTIDPSDTERRLGVLKAMLSEEGFVPEIRRGEGKLVVRECNCPFPEAVKRTRLPCHLEAKFYERLFDQRVERVSYIPYGHPACVYEFPAGENEALQVGPSEE